jgi:aspartyl protease/PDZ domain-containing protein
MRPHPLTVLIAVSLTTLAAAKSDPADATAQQVVSRWRRAVHARAPEKPQTATLTSTSREGGIPGKVEESSTTAGDYRVVVKRQFDETEVVATERTRLRRDWNGFLRPLEGEELARLRDEAFETSVLTFGPPKSMQEAQVAKSADGKRYALTVTAPGGKSVTWTVDAASWLPLTYERPGEDSVITTTFSGWRDFGGVLTPAHGKVSETNKPDFDWERSGLTLEPALMPERFSPPKAGPSDVRMEAVVPPIPFDFDSAHIIFKASLNGRPPSWWLLDTGADQQVINSTRLEDYGLKSYASTTTTGGGGTADYSFAAGATFTLPGVELRDQHVAVIDQTGLERALGMPLGGLLGYDFISRFVIEIDYDKKLLTLHDPATWSYSGSGFIVPVVFDNGIPFTHGVISVPTKPAIPCFFVIDFGAAETMTLTSAFVKANDLASLAQTNANVNRSPGLEHQFFTQSNVRGRVDKLTLGGMEVKDMPINMSVNTEGAYASASFSGTVGESLYRRYHVFLDYARQRVIFEPTAEAAKPFPERRTYGLTILASGADLHTYPVTGVRPGSPAERAGFQKGDVIAAVDRAPASDITLGQLRLRLTKEGEALTIDVARGEEKLTIPVKVELVSLDAR